LVYRTFPNCLIVWDATETCRLILGFLLHSFRLCQVRHIKLFVRIQTQSKTVFLILGFLSHPQTVYPSYLTPPLSLNHANINMSQLNMMAHGHHNGGLRISPQNIPQPPSHLPPVSTSNMSMMPQSSSSVTMSPSSIQQSPPNLALRSPSPDKKSADLNVDSSDEQHIITKEGAAINMTISPQSGTTDIRTNSIAALRIKAKEHLENINKNLTMV
jgi:hypothetical protein